ncbi:MAG: M48 family metalloprotease [Candidatus Omnitrophica bacterium]|nr:M48 family metalloprotease [Candidatus Omnitrophota bacterium]
MNCPACNDIKLQEVMTRQGALVDYCEHCGGIWLDKGEIYYFTDTPTYLRQHIERALVTAQPSRRRDPSAGTEMVELSLFKGALTIDYSPQTGGIWLDKGEVDALPGSKGVSLKLRLDKRLLATGAPPRVTNPVKLPDLHVASGITLSALYFMLGLVLIVCVQFDLISPSIALLLGVLIAGLQFALGPLIMDVSLRWFYRVRWATERELPGHLSSFIRRTAAKHAMTFPRVGLIPDGSPNAFTYGHTPNNARIVVTQGLMDLLEDRETEAVVAHELGHALHWDMLIMTIANLVPLILYYLYRTMLDTRSRGRNGKGRAAQLIVGIGAFILYVISHYLVLWFSRIREFFADRFAGEEMGDPNSLASALVKIGYGLAGRDREDTGRPSRKGGVEAIGALGIFDPGAARAFAVASYARAGSMGGDIDKERLKGAMRWDMWNPWALYYQLHSTHPLIARRLLALSKQAEAMGREPYIIFDERRPESFWDEFFIDLAVKYAGFLLVFGAGIVFAVTRNPAFLFGGISFLGTAYFFKTLFSYPAAEYSEMCVASLLRKVKVSGVRGVPCTLKGRIIGRGVPGLIWSEDFVLQDQTGIIFLDYQQPLGLWNFMFGLLRSQAFIGKEATLTGWYRRAPVPYIEVRTLSTDFGDTRCYTYYAKIIFSVILVILGLFCLIAL